MSTAAERLIRPRPVRKAPGAVQPLPPVVEPPVVRRPPVTVSKTSSGKRLAIAFLIALGMAGLVVMVLRRFI